MPGTVAAYQPLGLNEAEETLSPGSGTLATSWSCQPEERVTGAGKAACAAAGLTARAEKTIGNETRDNAMSLTRGICKDLSSMLRLISSRNEGCPLNWGHCSGMRWQEREPARGDSLGMTRKARAKAKTG